MRSTTQHLEQFRLALDEEQSGIHNMAGSMEGMFLVPIQPELTVALQIKSSELFGWDRVAVIAKPIKVGASGQPYPDEGRSVRAPTWKELRFARRLFWEEDEIVYTIIPHDPPEGNMAKTVYMARPQAPAEELPLWGKWKKLVDDREEVGGS